MASRKRKGAKKDELENLEELVHEHKDNMFSQHLFKLVYEFICSTSLPSEIQIECDLNPIDECCPFTGYMGGSMLRFMQDFTYEDDPCHILSKRFKKKWNALLGSATISYFKFIGNYGLMSAAEFLGNSVRNEDSPLIFFQSIAEYFQLTRRRHKNTNFFECLDSISEDQLSDERDYARLTNTLEFDMVYNKRASERMFVLDIMQLIFRERRKRLPDYLRELRRKLNDEASTSAAANVERPLNYFTRETESHLLLVNENVDYVECGEIVTIDTYCRKLKDKTFNELDFLEFCVYYTKKALYFFKNANVLPPFKAFLIIVCVFETAFQKEFIFMNNLSSASSRDVQAPAPVAAVAV